MQNDNYAIFMRRKTESMLCPLSPVHWAPRAKKIKSKQHPTTKGNPVPKGEFEVTSICFYNIFCILFSLFDRGGLVWLSISRSPFLIEGSKGDEF